MGPGSAAPPAADAGPARHVAVPSSQFWHETRGLRTGHRYEFWVTASTAAGEGPATRIVTQSPEIRGECTRPNHPMRRTPEQRRPCGGQVSALTAIAPASEKSLLGRRLTK